MKRVLMPLMALIICAGVASNETYANSDLENTKQNARDKNNMTLTPMDQGESEADIRITAEIRKAIVNDKSLSVNAENIKVIAKNGQVTLRGPVKTLAERAKLVEVAKKVAGNLNVVDELDIESN